MAENTFAWLVELGPSCVTAPHYLFIDADTQMEWTTDANLALRFSREADAKAIIKHYGWTEAIAVEHGWPADQDEGRLLPHHGSGP